jgi:superfamily II DNA helicase RecQ
MSKVISIIWDEGQCIGKWGDFRPEYKTAGNLRHLIPRTILFFLTPATLPSCVLKEVKDILGIRDANSTTIFQSNNRPNVHLTVCKMKYLQNSFKDLAFLVPDDWDPTTPLPYKFVIFFDTISESIEAAKYLQSRLPHHLRDKVLWFNSKMTPEFCDKESANFKDGDDGGLACTESFGMVRPHSLHDSQINTDL